jgi:5-methylthioadenosine/S-adenosylhomocysteine deaminase
MSQTLFTSVYVYDADSEAGMFGPSDVLVDESGILVIGSEAQRTAKADARRVDGAGHHLLLPGLINAHYHSPANHLKGLLPSMPLESFMLYESPADPALAPTPREAYLRTVLAALEMLRTGTTTVQDDAFVMPYPTPEIVDAMLQAYADCGIRASVALDQPVLPEREKLPFIGGYDGADLRAALDAPATLDQAGLLDMYEHLISTWHGAADGRLTAAVSISAPQRVTVDYFEAIDDLSRRHRIPLFAHMLETKVQRTLMTEQERFAGRSLVGYTADLGLLSDRMNVIHAVWTDDADLELIAGSGAVIAHNPVSNLRLGSGVAPYRRMLDLGIPVALGIDEAICDDSANLWGVIKTAGLIHNVGGRPSTEWPTAREVLDSLWRGGAAALLQGDRLGEIRGGFAADLVMLDLHGAAFTPLNDVRGQLVYCEYGADVRLTMVAGRVVVDGGVVTTVDEPALLAEARELFARKLPVIARANSDAAHLQPHYDEMVAQAARTDVGMNRWIGNPA